MRPQRVNSPAWLRCADKVVQLNEPQERHHLPNRMARLDTSNGDDNLTSHRLSRHRQARIASAARSGVADSADRPAKFQTGNSMEMSGSTVVSLQDALTRGRAVTMSLASPLGFGHAWAPPGHGVL